jgi:hypothetical protein
LLNIKYYLYLFKLHLKYKYKYRIGLKNNIVIVLRDCNTLYIGNNRFYNVILIINLA